MRAFELFTFLSSNKLSEMKLSPVIDVRVVSAWLILHHNKSSFAIWPTSLRRTLATTGGTNRLTFGARAVIAPRDKQPTPRGRPPHSCRHLSAAHGPVRCSAKPMFINKPKKPKNLFPFQRKNRARPRRSFKQTGRAKNRQLQPPRFDSGYFM